MTDIAAGQGKSGGGGRSGPVGKAGTRKTAAGGVAVAERETAKQAGGFYGGAMYLLQISDWPADKLTPEQPVQSSGAARLLVAAADPQDSTIPVVLPDAALFATTTFSLINSGNRTLRAPKRSWKARFDGPGDALGGQATLNLKAMYNDPSQMREALAWRYLAAAGIPAARHTYAKLTINGGYRGLFSLIEQVDKRFLKDHYGKNHKGNLYKAYCGDIGCATLEHRVGANGDDSGRQYFSGKPDDRAYRLKTNEDESTANTYDDLAALTRAIDGVGLPGGDARFGTDAFRTSLESVLNVKAFLRWAATNVLLGSWDNYFATPANYYLYNSGRSGAPDGFMNTPYFTFIPWDYDNSFGIDFFGTPWQYTDLLDPAGNTAAYWRANNSRTRRSHIPLVQNLLRNHDLCQYYLDYVEHMVSTSFTPDAIATETGLDDTGGLWARVSKAAFAESATPYGAASTGRQFTNDEVYRCGCKHEELSKGGARIEGVVHYVHMRRDRAGEQLQKLRAEYPSGASGATFPAAFEALH